MALTQTQIKHLKALAHHRKPVVTIGNAGLTAAVLREIGIALKAHELVKVKLPALEREARQEIFERICSESGAESVQHIGRMAIVYRRAAKPKIQLPA